MLLDKIYTVLKILSIFIAPYWLAEIVIAIVPDIKLSFWKLYLYITLTLVNAPMAVSSFWMTPADLRED